MIRRKRPEMAISNAELAALTRSMDEQHRDHALPELNAVVAEWQDEIRAEQRSGPSRRTFLLGAGGIVAATGALAACGSSKKSNAGTTGGTGSNTGTTGTSSSLSSADAKTMAEDASIENLAIFAYNAGLTAAKKGTYGTVPPAIPVFVETAIKHHTDHLQAFNAVLTTAKLKAITEPEPKLTPVVKSKFAMVKTLPALAELAVLLENVAAQSYQDDAATTSNLMARKTSATIMPVEMTHAAILYFVLGKYPGTQTTAGKPVSFNPLSSAAGNDVTTT